MGIMSYGANCRYSDLTGHGREMKCDMCAYDATGLHGMTEQCVQIKCVKKKTTCEEIISLTLH